MRAAPTRYTATADTFQQFDARRSAAVAASDTVPAALSSLVPARAYTAASQTLADTCPAAKCLKPTAMEAGEAAHAPASDGQLPAS